MSDLQSLPLSELISIAGDNPAPWKRGLPPGDYYPGMIDDFEILFTVIGRRFHRRTTNEQRAALVEIRRRNKEACSK